MADEETSKLRITSGTKSAVIFDTNAYRNLAGGKSVDEARKEAFRLKKCEEANKVFPLASPVVIWELAAHLGDTTDPHYKDCMSALTFLAEHTWAPKELGGEGICAFSDPESGLCEQLFGVRPTNAQKNVDSLSQLAAYVKKDAPELKDSAAVNNFKAFSTEMAQKETDWISGMQQVLNECSPDIARLWIGGRDDDETRGNLRKCFASDQFIFASAGYTVARLATLVGRTLSNEELKGMAEFTMKSFPVPFRFMSNFLQRFPHPKAMNLANPKKKRANCIWDSAICFCIGPKHEIDGAKLYLVTGDGAIVTAASEEKCGDRVMSLDDFLKSVGF